MNTRTKENILSNINSLKFLFLKLILTLAVMFFLSCNRGNKFVEKHNYYMSINGHDTANLSLTMFAHSFKGELKIYHGSRAIMDSGYVRGKIVGDTLIGSYYYISYGGVGEAMPISWLMRDKKIFSGSGALTKWLGFRHFDTEVPIDYNSPKFIFVKIKGNIKNETRIH